MSSTSWNHALKSVQYLSLDRYSAFRVYVRIMAANERDRGIRLTADEVAAIANDDAIFYAASNVVDIEGGVRC